MKRSSLETQIEILGNISQGIVKPTLIMYASNINWSILKRLLANLVKKGAIELRKNNSRVEYYITDKGRSILNHYDKSASLLGEEKPRKASTWRARRAAS